MLPLPPVAPPNWWPRTIRLGRDHYIRVDTCGYSVHPRAIGHRITVRTDTESIVVTCGNDVVAHHGRFWARHQIITDPEHAVAARHLRDQARPPARCLLSKVVEQLGVEPLRLGVDEKDRAKGGLNIIELWFPEAGIPLDYGRAGRRSW